MKREKRAGSSPPSLADRYFLEEMNPYSKRRPLKTKNIGIASSVLFVLLVFLVLFFGGDEEKTRATLVTSFAPSNPDNPRAETISPSHQDIALGLRPADGTYPGITKHPLAPSRSPAPSVSGGSPPFSRHSANQVIRRGSGGNDPGSTLPMGTTIPVRLLNAIVSTNTSSPVIAEIIEDVTTQGSTSIPALSRAIGSATYDEGSQRIQLRFQTLVYPDGDQHSFQAIGLMPDGSSGIVGEYHSGEGKRKAGRLLGHFIRGMADGMKERQPGGPFGMAYEPGTFRNGILGGLSLSAQDEANSLSDNLSNTRSSMTLPSGQPFLLFLEREYAR